MKKIEIDQSKLIFHPEKVTEWKTGKMTYPLYVEAGLTNNCNHNCVFCALDFLKEKEVFIKKDMFGKALKDMSDRGVKSIMFAGEGEPTLHKNIGYFSRKAKEYGLDVSITTNGVPLTHKKIEEILPNLSWLRFSVDSGSAENYALVHGTKKEDFDRLLRNIEYCVEFRERENLGTTIGAQFLVIPENRNEISKLASILNNIGLDNLQIKPYSHHPNSSNDLVVNPGDYDHIKEQISEVDHNNLEIKFRKEAIERTDEGITYNKCHGLSFFTLIDAKGNVLPCNLFYGKDEFFYGNLYKKPFREIWESGNRIKIIKKINSTGLENCRVCCRLDRENKYLNRLENPHPHDNFL